MKKQERQTIEWVAMRMINVAAGVREDFIIQRNQAESAGLSKSRQDWLNTKAEGAAEVVQKLQAWRDWELSETDKEKPKKVAL